MNVEQFMKHGEQQMNLKARIRMFRTAAQRILILLTIFMYIGTEVVIQQLNVESATVKEHITNLLHIVAYRKSRPEKI